MADDQHVDSISALHSLVAGSSSNTAWGTDSSRMADWQRGVLTRIHALTLSDKIRYLSSATADGTDWDFVAFTDRRVVRVVVWNANQTAVRFETSTFARASLQSLELLDVDDIPPDTGSWPTEINLIGHYRAGSVPLPLDRFASDSNKHDLISLLRSLQKDLTG
jgi:hypothetical protein